jgi:hypothetical protein
MATASQDSFVTFKPFNPGPIPEDNHSDEDVEMAEADILIGESVVAENSSASERLIIAVDFGTTFSSVAYATVSKDCPEHSLDSIGIRCISRYPGDRYIASSTYDPESSREDVPTELWYNVGAPRTSKITASPTSDEPWNSMADNENESGNDSGNDSEVDGEFTDDEDGKRERLFWGFGVQKHFQKMDIPKDGTTRLTRFKLLLGETSDETVEVRGEILPILRKLKRKDVAVGGLSDLIRDYLEQLFIHTLAELQKKKLLWSNTTIELVLCVPAVWPSKACRTMQVAMLDAVQLSGMGRWTNNILDNLFIVSEPEAAAACVLAEDNYDIYVSYSKVLYSLLDVNREMKQSLL